MLSNANFLILDEPTNHLDIQSKEILEDALNRYEGTILYVSHDRYFINRTAHRILDLSAHTFVNYIGNYDYYLEKHETAMTSLQSPAAPAPSLQPSADSEVKQDWKAQKEEQARVRKRENDLKKCEEKISALEESNARLEREMADPVIATQSVKLQELAAKQEQNNAELEKLYAEWEKLAE